MKYLLDTDHISFLQLRSGPEYAVLAARMAQHSPADFAMPIVSFHEQVLGANAFIQRAKNSVDTTRGYTLLFEILQGYCGSASSHVRRCGSHPIRRVTRAAHSHRHYGSADRLDCTCARIDSSDPKCQRLS